MDCNITYLLRVVLEFSVVIVHGYNCSLDLESNLNNQHPVSVYSGYHYNRLSIDLIVHLSLYLKILLYLCVSCIYQKPKALIVWVGET